MSAEYKTLHDLAADWEWLVEFAGFRIGRSGIVWENAQYGQRSQFKSVQISRLVIGECGLRQVTSYGDPDAIVTLVPKSKPES